MREAQRRQGDPQLIFRDVDIGGSGKEFMQECSTFLRGSPIVRAQEGKQIALGLVGEHLDQVGQMLALAGELDEGLLA